jgi:rhodanese-related sulfurtransferase
MKKILIATCIIGMMLVSSGVSISATKNKYENYYSMAQGFEDCPINISVNEAWDMLTNTDDGIQIPIDVRRNDEWNEGFINTPYPECPVWYTLDLLKNETALQEFMETYAGEEVVLYCKGGYRSLIGSYILCEAGFTGTVYNMLGGITEWIAQGYPIRNNTKPSAPTIDGPKKVGKNKEIDYKFSTEDAENDGVSYWVDWCGDGHCAEWHGPYSSEDEATLNHSWEKTGTFIIKAKVRDFYGNESDWTEFEINVPRNKASSHEFLERLLVRFPHTFSIMKFIFWL